MKQAEWKHWKLEQQKFQKGESMWPLLWEPKFTQKEEDELHSLVYFLVQRTDGWSTSNIFRDLTWIDAWQYDSLIDGNIFPSGCPCDFIRDRKTEKPKFSFEQLMASQLKFNKNGIVKKF
jgi:hypothetical protein